jgi:hypothetical protein
MKFITIFALAAWNAVAAGADPCQFLSLEDVKQILPDAKPGVVDRSKEAKYGLISCTWWGSGRVAISFSTEANTETVEREARGLVDGFVDPMNPKAANSVRVETLAIPGGKAAAVVEAVDASKGIVTAMEYVTVRGKQYQATILCGRVPGQDRAAKLKAIEKLAKAAAARM